MRRQLSNFTILLSLLLVLAVTAALWVLSYTNWDMHDTKVSPPGIGVFKRALPRVAVGSNAEPRRVLLVSCGNPFLERAVKALELPGSQVLTPAEYERTHPDGFDVVIFDRHTPEWMTAAGKFIYFGCAPTDGKLKVVKQDEKNVLVRDVAVQDWQRGHQVLLGLDLSKLHAAEMLKLDVPADAQTLVTGNRGPMVVLACEANRTNLVIAFDLLQSNWPTHVSFPVFLRNAVNRFNETAAVSLSLPDSAFDPPLTELRALAGVLRGIPNSQTPFFPHAPPPFVDLYQVERTRS